MNFEQKIFRRHHVNFQKLEAYGFQQKEESYIFSTIFMKDFQADITINKEGIVFGKVYDLNTEEEYINFRIEHQIGEFVSHVREEYTKLLLDICSSCFEQEYFISKQANRIAKIIFEKYQDIPDFPWKDSPEFGIFRNPNNGKWYGLIMSIDRKKLDKTSTQEEIEAINLKLDSNKIPSLLDKIGFYPAYHMNKKNWITITLDDTLTDKEIFSYIEESHNYTECPSSWIIPANSKYFDVIGYFENHDTITWKQPKNIHIHDTVYLYIGRPYSAILYKCEVIGLSISEQDENEPLSTKCVMNLKLQKKYDRDQYTLEKLKEYGIRTIRGPRSMPISLENEIK